jgi:hypothetical protein
MNWTGILLSVVTGFAGSLFVVLFLYRLRPRIEFSSQISETVLDKYPCYGFKMINRSPYPVLDVRAVLELVTRISVPGGQIYSAEDVSLINGNFFVVNKFDPSDSDANFAFRVRTTEDIRKIWTGEGQYLRLSVVGRHALSGFYGVFQQCYYTKGDIKQGSHQFGLSLDVQPMA